MTLDLRSSNYVKWSSFFKAMCGKFDLLRHINGTAPPNPLDAAWHQADCCVRSWLYGSVSESVLDFTMEDEQTGDLSIKDYDNKMKQAAAALRAAGKPVADSTLILNLLRGVNPSYNTTGDFIAATPNITFAVALDQLALNELCLANEAKVAASTALVASTPSLGYGSNCRSPSVPSSSQPRRKKGNGK
ncbi:uncharacterized protein [Setaria viridis]|uniref:uncharacterized protein n=1 Tax=Setaria viridis TaxID=4556 RepID=UPI0014938B56|nr:uncharacterized protein LOC117848998 [Setaria viridis]